jgi:hypothetical protein
MTLSTDNSLQKLLFDKFSLLLFCHYCNILLISFSLNKTSFGFSISSSNCLIMAANAPNALVPFPRQFPPNTADVQLAAGLDITQIGGHQRLIPSSTVEDEIHNDNPDDTFVVGLMLTVRMAVATMVYRPAPGTNKSQKTGHNNAKAYDRLLTFADVNSTGTCFSIMLQTKRDSDKFFNQGRRQGYGVGRCFLIGEPMQTDSKLGGCDAITLIDGFSGLVLPLKDGVQYMPNVPLTHPPDIGSTRFFCYHNQTNISLTHVKLDRSSCTGDLCDRQIDPNLLTTFRCGCLQTDTKRVIKILDMSVRVPCEQSFRAEESTTINNFRSLRTTRVFMDEKAIGTIDTNNHVHVRALRKGLKDMITWVNQKGGWTIVGWIRRGQKADESDTSKDAENLASINTAPHLTYMMPTDMSILETEDYLLKKFALTPAQLLMAA